LTCKNKNCKIYLINFVMCNICVINYQNKTPTSIVKGTTRKRKRYTTPRAGWTTCTSCVKIYPNTSFSHCIFIKLILLAFLNFALCFINDAINYSKHFCIALKKGFFKKKEKLKWYYSVCQFVILLRECS
jgi:hypothetical protein